MEKEEKTRNFYREAEDPFLLKEKRRELYRKIARSG